MKYQEVKDYCEDCQAQYRKDRYRIMENYFGISAGTIKDIISFDRYLRDILQVDPVGMKLESEWHKKDYQHNFENTTGQLFKTFNKLS
jgi:hypothetical protein